MKSNLIKIIVGAIALAIAIPLMFSCIEELDAGEIVVIQYPNGTLKVVKEAGWAWQGGGRATHYRKSNQFWFLSTADKKRDPKVDESDIADHAVPVQWNDGGKSKVSGSVRWDMPLADKQIIKVHSTFGSQEAIERSLIATNMEKAIFLTGPLMSSKESYAEKRNNLIALVEDQANKGVYQTRTIEVERKDELTGEVKKNNSVEVITLNGVVRRQEVSSVAENGLRLYNVSIKSIWYDGNVEKQIETQQKATMSVQTAIANAKRAEQDAITAAKQGEADAAKAKWEEEVKKAKIVTIAEANKAVAQQEVLTAALNKQRDILEGEGIAAKKRLVMQADGALDQKLKAYIQVQSFWAEAFKGYGGSLVPQFVSGGGFGGGNAGTNFMELMSAKAAKDLSLDLKNKN